MSQQASDVPRFVQILGRYRALIGIMAALGLLAGAVFAALNPPVFTSQARVSFPSACPAMAICGQPVFVPDRQAYIGVRLLQSLPSGVRVEPVMRDVLLVSVTAGTPDQAEAAADAAARSYLAYADALSSLSGQTWRILGPASGATGTAPMVRLRDDVLLGAVFGALLAVIMALAGSGATIDTLAAPPGCDVGEDKNRAGQEIGVIGREARYVSTGVPLEQMPLEYVTGMAAPLMSQGRAPQLQHETCAMLT
jgi:hypothetical protein